MSIIANGQTILVCSQALSPVIRCGHCSKQTGSPRGSVAPYQWSLSISWCLAREMEISAYHVASLWIGEGFTSYYHCKSS